MLTYWLMFLLPAMVALMMETQRTRALPGGGLKRRLAPG